MLSNKTKITFDKLIVNIILNGKNEKIFPLKSGTIQNYLSVVN